MNPVLIFRHIEHEGPGYFEDFLREHQIPSEMVCIDAGDKVPASLDNISALVFMGGAMSVNDPLPWIADEVRLIQQAIDNDLPVLGHCLGGQLIARALGGVVTRNKTTEIGWHATGKIDNATSRHWLAGFDDGMELFHWHSETFSIPAGATPILKSEFCANQAFVYGKTLALQCHVEMTEGLVRKWVLEDGDQLSVSASVQSGEQMLNRLAERVSRLNQVAATLYSKWIQGLERYK